MNQKQHSHPAEKPARIRLPLPFDVAGRSGNGSVREELARLKLHSVCQEAACPNLHHCFSLKRATFLILGKVCTRHCRFCNIEKGNPSAPDPQEPGRVAEAVLSLQLQHVVITSVTRDDLADGGAEHFVQTVNTVRGIMLNHKKRVTVELLIPDMQGNRANQEKVFRSLPEILNHNVETVPSLYPQVRPRADWQRSLTLIERAAMAGLSTKSGIMVGMGESVAEVNDALQQLRDHGCQRITIGQYLAPSSKHYPSVESVSEDRFREYGEIAQSLGFLHVESSSRVRSSYHAEEAAGSPTKKRQDYPPEGGVVFGGGYIADS